MLAMKERGYASSTVARKVAATKSFFHFLKEEGSVTDDPTLKLESPKSRSICPRRSRLKMWAAAGQPANPTRPRDCVIRPAGTLYATGLRLGSCR